ncbi:MAG: S8 family serine peptidase [Phaeodactylibacter sp.]|nr:S8 family serine peptidase [Phaeodactylibacter sp.]
MKIRFNAKRRLLWLSTLFLLCLTSKLSGQSLPSIVLDQESDILRETNAKALIEWAKRDSIRYYEERARAEAFAKRMGYPIKGKLKDGGRFELQGFDDAGQLKYYFTYNRGGASTISTDEVWPGGNAGTSLTGQGWTLAVWDGGRVRTTHAELSGKVVQGDNAATFDDHATHVTGTCIARGNRASARGMAYNGNAVAFDWNNDFSEMANNAAAGLRVSNHSYGLLAGWEFIPSEGEWYWFGLPSYSEEEDYQFGYYDSDSWAIDDIIYNAPFYLPVIAAGNDRDDFHNGPHFARNAAGNWIWSNTYRPQDGGNDGYDCINNMGCSKNTVVVGAVEELSGGYGPFTAPNDVQMSSFSSWGPTDDGRIKPDLVAKGVSVESCTAESNIAYDIYQGTSMAAPMVTGSILLIQEHINNLYPGGVLRASAMKALLIHTADECGSAPGPDYRFGWGLMNTQKAVEFLSNGDSRNWFDTRDSVTNGNPRSYTFEHDGVDGIKVTIAWTDPAGNVCSPPSGSFWVCDNRMLSNDLDLRLVRLSDNTEYFPWRLNPSSPASAATRGDNDRDNVEQVYVPSLPAGEYAIVIDHKGSLVGGEQIFSIMLSGIGDAPTVSACDQAQDIQCGQTLHGVTSGNAQPTPNCDISLNTAPGKWFRLMGDGATVTASTCSPDTDYDTQLAVFSGSCDNLICEAGNDDDDNCTAEGLLSTVQFFAESGIEYLIYVTGYSDASGSFSLQVSCQATPPVCSPPPGLVATEVGHAYCILDWDAVTDADFYQVQMRQLPNGSWQSSNEYDDPGVIFGNRVPDSDYEVQVRSKCGSTYSNWSPSIFFTTLGEGNPYCFSYGISWNYWIDRFAIKETGASLLNWQTGMDYGYNNFTSSAPVPELKKGSTYEFCFTPDRQNGLPNENLRYQLFFDWNNDQNFGSGDVSYTWCCTSSFNEFCEEVPIPDNIAPGEYRVRAMMIVNDTDGSNSACATGGEREVEDYTIRVAESAQPPAAAFTASSLCGQAPLTVSFTDNSNNTPNSWQWDFGNGQSSTQQNPTVTYNTPGAYTVTLTAVNTGGSDTEVRNAYITVVAPVSVSAPSGTTACLGESLTLSASGASVYNWTGPGLDNASGASVQATPSQAGNYTYQVVGMTYGCGTQPASISLSFLAPPQVSISPNAITACLGESVTLTASGASSYTWAGAGLSATTGAVVQASPAQPGSYTYQLIGSNGSCSSAPQMISLQFNSLPQVSLLTSATSVCLGQSLTLSANGGNTYTWLGPGVGGSTGSTVTTTPATVGSSTYQVTGNTNGCTSMPASVEVDVLPIPLLSVQASGNPVCLGDTLVLQATGASQYFWNGPGLLAFSGSGVQALPAQAGPVVYQLSGSANGCQAEPVSLPVNVENNPLSVAVEIGDCSGENVTFQAEVANGGIQPNLLWYLNDQPVWSGPAYTLFGAQTGDEVYCEVTAVNAPICTSPLVVQSEVLPVDCLTPAQEVKGLEDLQLFPNPNTGQFTLKLHARKAFESCITVFNNLGQEVLFRKLDVQSGEQQIMLTLPGAAAGLYHLVAASSDGMQVLKFVVE